MKKTVLLLAVLVSFAISGFCQNIWDASTVADSLKLNANATIRLYTTEYVRKTAESYQMKEHYVVTVWNEKGKDAAQLLLNYDRNSKVSNIKGKAYNALGILIKKLDTDDIRDFASNNNFTLYSDNRAIYYSPASNTYPYTIEYSYTIDYSATFGFPAWMPNNSYNISTEKAELTLISTLNLNNSRKELNYKFDFSAKQINNAEQLTWKAANIPAIKSEPFSRSYINIFPAVLLSPDNIIYEGAAGNFSSWNSLGKWIYTLSDNRDQLLPATVEKLKQLTDTIKDEKGKIKAVYQYMQNKTRYVNISMGIGGYQTIKAIDVDEKGYGDCKGLSNYTKALLKSIGIASCYTIIGSGDQQKIQFPDFTGGYQANHAILCVPLSNDTVWLECTSQIMPFNYIASNNSDRYALLITENGGKLVRTPVFELKNNLRASAINMTLELGGNASFDLKTGFRNYMYEDILGLANGSKKDQKDYLLKEITTDGVEIIDFTITNSTDEAFGEIKIKGKISKYAVLSGSRLFVKPNFLLPSAYLKQISNDRKLDIEQGIGYVYNDTFNLNIPANCKFEQIPANFSTSSVYGNFAMQYDKVSDNTLRITRSIQINNGNFNKSYFTEITRFLKNISKQENENIIVSK